MGSGHSPCHIPPLDIFSPGQFFLHFYMVQDTFPPFHLRHPRYNMKRSCESLSSFQNAASVLGMHVSWPKTKVKNLGTGQPLSDVSVDAHHVECIDNFTYLGSVQSSDGYCRPDIRRRIVLAASVMSSLRNIRKDQRLSLSTKSRIYQTLVAPSCYMHQRHGHYSLLMLRH